MALAIALVIIVNSVSAGVKAAQATVLQSVYGVGTDITVTEPATAQAATATQGRGGGPRFDFGAGRRQQNSGDTNRTIHTVAARRDAWRDHDGRDRDLDDRRA